jgi:ubiquinone/menaquinone biosynthesis C-methylase UbiE
MFWLISEFVYSQRELSQLAKDLAKHFQCDKIRVVDLCCGVGISTRAIRDAFPNAESIVGVDTSSEMVAMAEFLTDHTKHLTQDIPQILNIDFLKVSTAITLLKEQQNKFKFQTKKAIQYVQKNAENTALPPSSFNLVTIMYAFHEGTLLIVVDWPGHCSDVSD